MGALGGQDVLNTKITVDISELDKAAGQYVNLLGVQAAAIDGLIIKQVKFNETNNKASAIVEKQLTDNRRLQITLKDTGSGWEAVTSKITKHTAALTEEEKAAKKAAKADADRKRDQASLAKMLEDEKKPPDAGGGKRFLGFNDFTRIAEATLFKTALTSVTNALLDGVEKAKQFQIQISLIRTVSQEANISMDQWAVNLKKVSTELGIDLLDVTKAAYDAIQSQVVSGSQTFSFLKTAGELARTTGVDMKVTTDLLASTIQGFKLSITEADHTAAVLFKTVELGRIEVGELSNTFGKVAPAAGLLGIRTEEVGAAFATLTRQGIKTADASTLVINVISKLAKPTEQMKELLHSWGFESGQAAVKTLGFVEVLRRLEKETDGRLGDLSQYFNELRGLRGATGLTSSFEDYEKDLKKIDEADETYTKAREIRAESSADKLAKWNNAAKNTFIVAYGQEVVNILSGFAESLGKGDTSARIFANSILTLTAAVVGYKVATLAWSAIQSVVLARTTASAAAIYAETAATQARTAATALAATATQADAAANIARNAALKAYVPAATDVTKANRLMAAGFIAVAAAAAGYYGIKEALNRQIKVEIDDMTELNRIYDENLKARGGGGQGKSQAQQELEAFTKSVNDKFALPLKANAEAMKAMSASIEANKQDVKNAAEAWNVSYKGAVDTARDGIKKLNSEISKSKTFIESNATALRKMRESVDDTIRKTQMKYATDDQKRILNAMNVQRLFKESEELFNKGDEQSVKAAQEKLKDIAAIYEQDFDLEQEMAKKRLEEYLQRNPWAAQQPGGNVLSVSTLPLQQKLNALLDYQEKKQKEIAANEEKANAAKEKQIKTEEERIRKFEQAFKNFADFDIMKNGKVDPKFMTGGKVDQAKIQAEMMRLGRAVLQTAPGSMFDEKGNATAATMDFYLKMMERTRTLTVEGNLQANKEMLTQDQDRLVKMRDSYIEKYKEIKNAEAKFSGEFFGPAGTTDKFKGDAKALLQLTDAKYPAVEKYFQLNFNKRAERTAVVDAQEEAKKAGDEYFKAVEALKANARKGSSGELLPRKEDIEAVGRAYSELYSKVSRIAGLLGGNGNKAPGDPTRVNPDDFSIERDGRTYRLGDMREGFDRRYYESHEKNAETYQGDKKTDALKSELGRFYEEAVKPLEKAFPELTKQIETSTKPAVLGFYGDLVNSNSNAIKQVQELQKAYENLKKTIKDSKLDGKVGMAGDTLPTNPTNATVNPGGVLGADDAQYFATGGYVGNHPGSPKGNDTIPAWLSPGEFIVNAQQTKKFYAQLVDINRGVSPRYYARGGYVTTTVGDVHVHMEANSQPSATRVARQMGQELRREIRRGNVKLH